MSFRILFKNNLSQYLCPYLTIKFNVLLNAPYFTLPFILSSHDRPVTSPYIWHTWIRSCPEEATLIFVCHLYFVGIYFVILWERTFTAICTAIHFQYWPCLTLVVNIWETCKTWVDYKLVIGDYTKFPKVLKATSIQIRFEKKCIPF